MRSRFGELLFTKAVTVFEELLLYVELMLMRFAMNRWENLIWTARRLLIHFNFMPITIPENGSNGLKCTSQVTFKFPHTNFPKSAGSGFRVSALPTHFHEVGIWKKNRATSPTSSCYTTPALSSISSTTSKQTKRSGKLLIRLRQPTHSIFITSQFVSSLFANC